MPKYIVTNGSNFQPFTYDELARPIQQMAEAHNAAQDQYDALSMETAALGRYISDNEDDKQAKALYDEYNNRLRTLQDNLWNNGYTSSTRKDLSAAKTGYAGDITRLQAAIKSRQERSKEYWDTKHKHPDMIMGADPGLSGLDNYLNDDTYGQNYYSYSGTQFMGEVGTDAKARANEMLRDPRIMNDPRLAGYITRITQDGFTSQEVMAASQAVRSAINGDNTAMQNLDPASIILADVLMNHLNSTGAAGNVSAEEFNRLFDYGVSGLSQAIGKTDVQYMSDKVWDFNRQIALQNHSHALSEASKIAAENRKSSSSSGSGSKGKESMNIEDSETTSALNAGAAKARKKLEKTFGSDALRITKSGYEVRGGAEASELVYSGDLRRRAYRELGFDIGRDLTHMASKDFLTGEIERNGVVYETQYNPRANGGNGAIKIREKGSNTPWNYARNDVELTNKFNRYRSEYEDNLDYYKKNDPEIYKMATVDPDKQYKMYKDDGYNFNTSLTDYKNSVINTPKYNDVVNVDRTWVAHSGTDSGKYIERMSGLISNSIVGGNRRGKIRDWSGADGGSDYLHALTPYGTLDNETIIRPGSVFKYDKEGNINNITGIQLDANSILNDYIIIGIKGDKNEYGVGINMMRSDLISGLFSDARTQLLRVLNNPMYSSEEKEALRDAIVEQTSVELKDIVGYWTNTQSQGGTNQDNLN